MNRLPLLAAACLLVAPDARAGKVPLRPEELREESALIVVGRVESHAETDGESDDGTKTRSVVLTLRVESVEKGPAQPGDTVKAGCWVVIRGPRKGELWDSGHYGIPADGSSATFFLEPKVGEVWPVIYPNGIGKVTGPTLSFLFERSAPPAESAPAGETPLGGGLPVWVVAAGVVAVGVVVAGVSYLSRRGPSRSPS